jgi:hypothetical protein
MNSTSALLLFWAITLGYLAVGVILVALVYRMDKQHRHTQRELAELQRQAPTIQRSACYLEGLARVAHGAVEEMEEESAGVCAEP